MSPVRERDIRVCAIEMTQRKPAPIGWMPPDGMNRPAWRSAGIRLGGLSRSSNWWVGDWLRYGAAKWGEKYVVAARITGYDPHSLENMVYVASRFDISLRRENLSWSHHFVVAALGREEQGYWLDLATEGHLSVNDLRIELRAVQRSAKAARGADASPAEDRRVTDLTVCPQCGFQLRPRKPPKRAPSRLIAAAGATIDAPK
jgi:hypothetical protein